MAQREQQRLLRAALEREAHAQRMLLDGDPGAAGVFAEVAELYRQSWEAAHPTAYGRLIGMLKAAVLAGGGGEEAELVRDALGGDMGSATRAYAVGLAALVEGQDQLALDAAEAMLGKSQAFARAAAAIEALARRDTDAYRSAITTVLADFETREEHLTGVAFADTAAVLEVLAEHRGMAIRPQSDLLPQVR